MKQIKLRNSDLVALVDDDLFDTLSKFKWDVVNTKSPHIKYASIGRFAMHRMVMGCKLNDGKKIDHIDHNGLNNQRSNLRICTHSENMMNRIPRGVSKYLGVSILKVKKKNRVIYYWRTSIQVNKKFIVNTFPYTPDGEVLAAKRYDELARFYFKEFANPNFK